MKDGARVNLYWSIAALISCGLGWLAGSTQGFEFHKLLNLIGLCYDLIAVVFLSYVILTDRPVQAALAHHASLAVIAFTLLFPAAFSVGTFTSSGKELMDGGIYAFILISLVPTLYIYASPVLEPLSYKNYSPEKRVKILGTIILFMGFAFQVVASTIDTFLLTKPSI
ncbi:MAG: hypothetical protein ABJ000_18380 [Saccharospirillum sp.]|uniref:hypothetical protein n=1 Tax=Saccharospirillum sp. TaxID=2033801 RepID=UPI003297D23D